MGTKKYCQKVISQTPICHSLRSMNEKGKASLCIKFIQFMLLFSQIEKLFSDYLDLLKIKIIGKNYTRD